MTALAAARPRGRDVGLLVLLTFLPGLAVPWLGLQLPVLLIGVPLFALGVVHLPTGLFITGFAISGFTFLNPLVGFNLARAFGVMFLLAWGYYRLLHLREEPARIERRYLPFVLLTALACLSAFWSVDPGTTIRALPRRIEGVVFGLMLFDCIRDRRRLAAFAGGFAFGATLASALVVEVYLSVGRFIPQLPGEVHRGTIIGLNPNGLSMNVGIAMFVILGYLGTHRGLRHRAALVVFPIMALAVLFMASRGAGLAIVTGLAYLWLTRLRAGDKIDLRRSLAWAAMVAATILLLVLVTDLDQLPMWVRFSRASSLVELSSGRAGIWSAAALSIYEHPILGSGFGTFSHMYNEFRELSLLTPSVYVDDLTAHNDVLATVVDLGLGAGLLFGFGVASFLWPPADRPRSYLHDVGRAAAVVLVAGGMFNAMFDLKEAYSVLAVVAVVLGMDPDGEGADRPGVSYHTGDV
jgi:hypothetical protein